MSGSTMIGFKHSGLNLPTIIRPEWKCKEAMQVIQCLVLLIHLETSLFFVFMHACAANIAGL